MAPHPRVFAITVTCFTANHCRKVPERLQRFDSGSRFGFTRADVLPDTPAIVTRDPAHSLALVAYPFPGLGGFSSLISGWTEHDPGQNALIFLRVRPVHLIAPLSTAFDRAVL